VYLCSSIAFFDCQQIFATAESEIARFDVSGGKAKKTLKQAAQQAGLEIFFSASDVRGVTTLPIQGELVPIEAFNLMLADTSLAIFQHEKSGVYTIRKASIAEDADGDPNLVDTIPVNENKKTINGLLKGLLALAVASGGTGAMAQESEDEDGDIFELSPFLVDASEDIGYRATSTLAGTRLNTKLRDVGSAISVLTKEFFDDTGATDASTVLSYALNMEVGGAQGNYAGGDTTVYVNTDAQRAEPQSGQRVRGLAAASLTRNYFLTDIPFDEYNTDLVTINRGPNSLLFGIGSPGGIVDNGTKQASFQKDHGEVSFRLGERSSHRASIDYNKALIEGRLGVRIASLWQNNEYQQRPAYENTNRQYLAFNSLLSKGKDSGFLGKTRLHGNAERGDIHGTPPNVIPPIDGITSWFSAPDPSLQNIPGANPFPSWVTDGSFNTKFTIDTRPGTTEQALRASVGSVTTPYYLRIGLIYSDGSGDPFGGMSDPSISGVWGRTLYNQANEGKNRFDNYATTSFFARRSQYLPGFKEPVILDQQVLNNQDLLLSGLTNTSEQNFDQHSITLEQELFNGKGGIELSVDHQTFESGYFFPFNSRPARGDQFGSEIMVDVSEYLFDETPNPNVGRMLLKDPLKNIVESEIDRDAHRATAFYSMDFTERGDFLGLLGKHVFTGFYSEQTIEQVSRNYGLKWVSDTLDVPRILNGPLNNFRRDPTTVIHFGPDLRDSRYGSLADIRITEPIVANLPNAGDTYLARYWDRADRQVYDGEFTIKKSLEGGNANRQEIASEAFSIQSAFFDNKLVGLVGWRTDDSTSYEKVGNALLPTGEWDPANLAISTAPTPPITGDTFTWSVVGHFPEDKLFELPFGADLSVHYNESENFSPKSISRNVYGEILGSPTGNTKDFGFLLELLDRRLGVRVNWFETTSSNAESDLDPGWIFRKLDISMARWWEARDLGQTIEESLAHGGPVSQSLGFTDHDDVIEALANFLGPDFRSLRDPQVIGGETQSKPINGLTSTTDFKAEGVEIEVVGNLTDNWRLSLNVGKQETIQTNTGPALVEFEKFVLQRLEETQLGDLATQPHLGNFEVTSYLGYNIRGGLSIPLANARGQDGTVSSEQRKWRMNLVTSYGFTEGPLAGFTAGGALRWQDKASIGYGLYVDPDGLILSDLDRPFFGDEQLNGDIWVGYGRKLMEDKVNWRVQLNIRNAFGDDDMIPVAINPDGRVAVVRNPNPQEFFLTNTFSF